MKISYFKSVKQPRSGEVLTPELFWAISDSADVIQRVKTIRKLLADHPYDEVEDKIKALKEGLPVITWQASFVDNYRRDANAIPSGLYMIDVDHCDKEQMGEIITRAKGLGEEWGIVYIGETPKYGVRIVAECKPGLDSIAACQEALFAALGVEDEKRDTSCVDWARCSFMMPAELIHFVDASIFDEQRQPRCAYEVDHSAPNAKHAKSAKPREQMKMKFDDSEQTDYKGIPLKDIAREWLRANGGEPEKGNRNNQLFKLCLRLRYICDFNEAVMIRNIDHYGLPEDEVRQVVHSANVFARAVNTPSDLVDVVDQMLKRIALGGDTDEDIELSDINDTSKMPPLPPVFKEWFDIAPADFKVPTILVQLPILGSLGSALRAKYLDGTLHSPSFQVSLEAPQASGKSFMRKIIDVDLALMKEHDDAEREKERQYKEKVAQLKLTNTKVTKKDKDEVLGEKPQPLIRYCPATMSITQLLQRMYNARGLHLFAMAEEIDTVHKAFKRGFSSFSDALRCSFDNAEYGQDYASENSFSGIVKLYYNVLYSGTPKAMRRFYPDVEDGLVSRVLFCTLPDQFGKPHPHWAEMTEAQSQSLQLGLTRLNEITLHGETVQPQHIMTMDWLASDLEQWVISQQKLAVETNDRTRDIFCRRSAVVGFRAGMLAFFLWGEIPQRRKSVMAFARWIANMMLKQHLTRFNIEADVKNTMPFAEAFEMLKGEFTISDLIAVAASLSIKTPGRQIIYKWFSAGLIAKDGEGKKVVFKKIGHES